MKFFRFFAIAALALNLVGCAGMRAARARENSIRQSMTDYVYQGTPESVLPLARQLLVEKGLVPKDAGPNIIETDWASSYSSGSTGSSSSAWRFIVSAVQVPNGTRVTVMKTVQSSSSGSTGYQSNTQPVRDFPTELELLRRIDPAAAEKISTEAETRAAEAANAG